MSHSAASIQTIRSLRQPGPAHPNRIDCFRGDIQELRFGLQAGVTLNEALATPLIAAGFQCGTVTFHGTELDPFRYVMPGPADDDRHVAYFSAPQAPLGMTRIERANATFGWADGKPLVHCHAAWVEACGSRRGGHILPLETIVAAPGEATAWGFREIRVEASLDLETNFTLFQPSGTTRATGADLVARIKPNEDVLQSLEAIAQRHGISDAIIRGSLGSLIGARFMQGEPIDDLATEVLVREGYIRNGRAALDLLVVDMRGRVHEGWLRHGENPVCITFDIVIEVPGSRGSERSGRIGCPEP